MGGIQQPLSAWVTCHRNDQHASVVLTTPRPWKLLAGIFVAFVVGFLVASKSMVHASPPGGCPLRCAGRAAETKLAVVVFCEGTDPVSNDGERLLSSCTTDVANCCTMAFLHSIGLDKRLTRQTGNNQGICQDWQCLRR